MKTYVANVTIKEINSKDNGTYQTMRSIITEQIADSTYQSMRNKLADILGTADANFILGKTQT